MTLEAVMTQKLLPRKLDGGVVLASEILLFFLSFFLICFTIAFG